MKSTHFLAALSMLLCTSRAVAQQTDIYLADPTIYSENGTYYLYGTADGSEQGFPLYTSSNLHLWTRVSTKPTKNALLKGKHTYGSKGFWAPQVLKRNGVYYLAYTADENIAIAHSASPFGPFTQTTVAPIDEKAKKIDPFLYFDDNGKVYLYHVRFTKGNVIWVAEMKPDLSAIIDSTLKPCIQSEEAWEHTRPDLYGPVAEGPTVVKHKGTYYLFYSSNHFILPDYAVGYATAPSPTGPWAKYCGNPIISRKIVGENGSGHGDLFAGPQGKLFYVYHTHKSDSVVNNRKTRIIPIHFVKDKSGIDKVTVDPSGIIKPVVKE